MKCVGQTIPYKRKHFGIVKFLVLFHSTTYKHAQTESVPWTPQISTGLDFMQFTKFINILANLIILPATNMIFSVYHFHSADPPLISAQDMQNKPTYSVWLSFQPKIMAVASIEVDPVIHSSSFSDSSWSLGWAESWRHRLSASNDRERFDRLCH